MNLRDLPEEPFSDDGFDPLWFGRVLAGVHNRYGPALERMLAAANLRWLPMKLWRKLQDDADTWTPLVARRFLPLMGQYTNRSPAALWSFVCGKNTNDPLLVELACCQFFRDTVRGVEQLTAALKRLVTPDLPWQYAGRCWPAFMMPPEQMYLCLRSLMRSLRIDDRALKHRWLGLHDVLHETYYPIDSDRLKTLRGRILFSEYRLLKLFAGAFPLDCLDNEELAELIDSIWHDVLARGVALGIMGAGHPLPAPLLRLETIDCLWVLGDRVVLKRDHGSAVWALYERSADAERNRFLDQSIAYFAELQRMVRWRLGGNGQW